MASTFKPLASDNGSQGEAKCYTKEFKGRKGAKGIWSRSDICVKRRSLNSKSLIEADVISGNISLIFMEILLHWLPLSNFWYLTMGSQKSSLGNCLGLITGNQGKDKVKQSN